MNLAEFLNADRDAIIFGQAVILLWLLNVGGP